MSNTVVIDGRECHLGCLPRLLHPGAAYPILGSDPARPNITVIPREQWAEVDFSHLVAEILDQDGTNACNAFAAVQTLHVLRAEAGLPYVRLSPGNLYGRINGGVDGGSYLSDAIKELEKDGVCTAQTVPELEWRPRRWPVGWQTEAKKFRILEAWDCPTFEHLASALLLGFPVNLGVFVGRNFSPQSDGWLPDYRGGGGGHAMCGVGLCYHSQRKTWGIKVANSWGTWWGQDGFGVVPESYFRTGAFADAWAVRGIVDPQGDW
ncbi:MAG TPA: C1 family peptidase [Bacillota bacterium]|nr:C1 family peptidase [Bacillota bacterium]HPZ14597.1 C1 family peptidase [Bacillota bacterium]